eukprot:6478223-Amphidinium_carterae.2
MERTRDRHEIMSRIGYHSIALAGAIIALFCAIGVALLPNEQWIQPAMVAVDYAMLAQDNVRSWLIDSGAGQHLIGDRLLSQVMSQVDREDV